MSSSTNSSTDVHPSAVGRNTAPDTKSSLPERRESGSSTQEPSNHGEYPEQRHAGAVGYGPNFHQKPGFLDKITSVKEQVVGKATRNPELVEKGHDRWTGELKQKELDADAAEDPFANPDEDKEQKQQPERTKSSTSNQSQ
ncbi:Calmodulin-like protein [Mycena indigotica]|uniref:Calmodulin-like protein n=1 Tax=Mycena indigotica TaxID=2126181 RepID=A0A8H6W960_9AGAR|nr:Calmodulin-like protein [Mycena indigotica]KAF7303804.1 Calmodulin-like protein [Mycena indigotica]